MRNIRVTSWSELQDTLFDDTYDPSISRWRSTFAYRGLGDESYLLSNSISRLGKPYPTLERNLIKQFRKYAHRDVVDRDTDWHWMSVAQHHGLPTRLMDWTYSPLVALHFATCDLFKMHLDGAVWKVSYAEVHSLLQKQLTDRLRRLGGRIFSVDTLCESVESIEKLDSLSSPNHDVMIFFEPPSLDGRIVHQFAYFSVISNPFMTINDWFNQPHVMGQVHPVKIIIPASLKWEIRDKLDQSNINERVLMPGLDGLCQWLARHYKAI